MQGSNAIARASLAAVLAMIFPIGCGGPSTAGPDSAAQLSIGQVAQIFHVYQKGQKPPPQGIKDLQPMQRMYPAALESIKSGEVLVYWGAGISDAPDAASTVLAYHKDVPEKGGEVLMQDGTAKIMTAEQFQAASKPAGATTDGAAAGGKKK